MSAKEEKAVRLTEKKNVLSLSGDEKEEKEGLLAEVMSREQTLFFDAVMKGTLNERLLTALLAKNIAIDGIDASCHTATMHCIRRNDLTTLQLLLDHGANLNVITPTCQQDF